jgi:putative acyl-CoA dehydrogenase
VTLEVRAAPASAVAAGQPPERTGDNVFAADVALAEALRREGAEWAEPELERLGEIAGRPETIALGFAANEHPPRHVPYDRSGARVDDLELHPAWHSIMALAVEHGLHGAPWASPRPGAHVARAAKVIVLAQVEAGFTCPIAMTYSCVPALRLEPSLAAAWEPLATGPHYDPRTVPRADKRGALIGMALTERQGGSDVRSNATVARPLDGGGPGSAYAVTGSKWFVSALMSDAYFVLATAPAGLSLLLVPRLLDDGSPNGFRLDRLKHKLGNHSNPTGEVDFDGSIGTLVGEEGAGVRAIMAMIGGTRHDCVLGSTAVMRLGLSEALHWAEHRIAFGRPLVEQPAMRGLLADLALEAEAATAGALRLSRAIDEAARGDGEAAVLRRIAAPVLKYWVCKRAPAHAAETVECLGGYGYVEESRLPRMYREAPLMSIWEGSGNVQALDVLRALRSDPRSGEALMGELRRAQGADRRYDAAVRALEDELGSADELNARVLAARAATCFQASLLLRHGPPAVADAFCGSRLGEFGGAFGMLPRGVDVDAIVERCRMEQ